MAQTPDAQSFNHGAGDGAERNNQNEPSETAGSPTTGNTPRPLILLLEDNPDEAEPLAEALDFSGYVCVIARTVVRARAELAREDQVIAVLITDLTLTESDGVTFIHEARAIPRYATLPAIVTTGHDTPAARERVRALGRTSYLVKAFSITDVLALIARWTQEKN